MMDSNRERLYATDELDQAMIAILAQLWRARTEDKDRPWSLARLCKQANVRMSSLRRYLTLLEGEGLASVDIQEDGLGSACLTESGAVLCRDLFGLYANESPRSE
jgi:DNA-binding IclR family transcriptional regulator